MMADEREAVACELCGRIKPLTFHHLIPRHVHRKRRFRRHYQLSEMRSRGLYLCKLCHDGIHDLIPDEKDLASRYNTRDLLMAHEGLRRHIEWVRKQK